MNKLFKYNNDIEKTAYMNWRMNNHEPIQNMNALADGYFTSALLLVKECLDDNYDKKADILIFSMLFSVNQAIELYAKSICWSINILLGYKSTFNPNHDIRGIWFTAKQKINEYGFDYGREKEEFDKKIINLESYLNELYNIIKKDKNTNDAYLNIDFSRYPLDKYNKNYHFYLNRFDNVVVDLESFQEMFTDIYECLSTLAEYYYGLVVDSWQQND